jgi:hypothetical protein
MGLGAREHKTRARGDNALYPETRPKEKGNQDYTATSNGQGPMRASWNHKRVSLDDYVMRSWRKYPSDNGTEADT